MKWTGYRELAKSFQESWRELESQLDDKKPFIEEFWSFTKLDLPNFINWFILEWKNSNFFLRSNIPAPVCIYNVRVFFQENLVQNLDWPKKIIKHKFQHNLIEEFIRVIELLANQSTPIEQLLINKPINLILCFTFESSDFKLI